MSLRSISQREMKGEIGRERERERERYACNPKDLRNEMGVDFYQPIVIGLNTYRQGLMFS